MGIELAKLHQNTAQSFGFEFDNKIGQTPQNSSQNLLKYPWCTTLSYSHGYCCSFFIELNALASGTMTSGAQLLNLGAQCTVCEFWLTNSIYITW
jgi:fructosamine-3-kinase